jgi:uncharacterized protein YggE
MQKTMDNSVKITLIIAGTIVLLAALGWLAFSGIASGKTVSSQGSAEIKALPDIVSVYLSVETNATTASEAKEKNAEISDAVLTNLLKLGLERKDITTQNYNIYEDFEYTRDGRKSLGWKVSNQMKVELKSEKMNLAGDVIDAGVNAGATVSYINFELSLDKQNELKAQALKSATQDATTKAASMASGAGKKLGSLVSVTDSSFDYRPWPIFAESAVGGVTAAKAAVTNIQPGEQTVSASVLVTYKIV